MSEARLKTGEPSDHCNEDFQPPEQQISKTWIAQNGQRHTQQYPERNQEGMFQHDSVYFSHST